MKLIQIAYSWYLFAQSSSVTRNLMEKRLAICDECPHKTQLSAAGTLLVQAVNEQGSTFQCGICHCPLATLTAAPNNSCKDKRWGPQQEESYF